MKKDEKKLLRIEKKQNRSILIRSSQLFLRQNHGVPSGYDRGWYCLSHQWCLFN